MHKQPRPRELACKKYIKKYGFARRYVIANSKSARPRIAYKTKSFLYNKGWVNPHCQGFTQKRYLFCFKTMLQTQKTAHPCELVRKSTWESIGLRNGSWSRRADQPVPGMLINTVDYCEFWGCNSALSRICIKTLHFLLWNNAPNAKTAHPCAAARKNYSKSIRIT